MTDRMRASDNEAKGTSGESYVTAKLEELGCGVVRDSDHDWEQTSLFPCVMKNDMIQGVT